MRSQIKEMQTGLSQPTGFICHIVISAFVSLGVAFTFCWRLTLLILAAIPIVVACSVMAERNVQDYVRECHRYMSEATKIANSAISNIAMIKTYNTQYQETRDYGICLKDASKSYEKEVRAHASSTAIAALCKTCLIAIALAYSTFLIRHDLATPSSIVTALLSCITASGSADGILNHLIVVQRSRVAIITIHTLLAKTEFSTDYPNTRMKNSSCPLGQVEFQDVTFSYPKQLDRFVLHQCSLTFYANRTTFVLGKSGSGKSTLGKILIKLYPIRSGMVLVDGINLKDLDKSWLRNNITFVQQQSVLFEDTIWNNIVISSLKPDLVTFDQVHECLEMASLTDTVQTLPLKLDTNVGSQGAMLSGGQRQRMALARARMRSTSILILDECTSALDQMAKKQVIQNIVKWRNGRTTIVITHDPFLIGSSDFVYVMAEGKVIERGLPSELQYLAGLGNFNSYQSQLSYANTPTSQNALWKAHSCNVASNSAPSTKANNHLHSRVSQICLDPFKIENNILGVKRKTVDLNIDRSVPRTRHYQLRASLINELRPGFLGKFVVPNDILNMNAMSPRNSIRLQYLNTHLLTDVTSLPDNKLFGSSITELASKDHLLSLLSDMHKTVSILEILSSVWPSLNRHERMKLVLAVASSILNGVIPSIMSFSLSHLFRNLLSAGEWQSQVKFWSSILVGLGVLDASTKFVSHYYLERVGQAWINFLRLASLRRIVQQPMSWLDIPQNSSHSLCEILDRNAEESRNLLARFAVIVLIATVMLAVSLEWGFILCWKLTLAMTVMTLIGLLIMDLFKKVSISCEKRCNTADEVAHAVFAETFTEIETVQTLTLERHFHKKYIAAMDTILSLGYHRALLCGIMYGCSTSCIFLITAGVMTVVAFLIRSDQFSVSSIIATFMILTRTFSSVESLLSFIPQMASSIEAGSRILRLTNLSLKCHEHFGQVKLDSKGLCCSTAISFNQVSFEYPMRSEALVLSNFTLSIRSNECTAIVGKSGSGKSTLASLILKLYSLKSTCATSGCIEIYGHRIESLETQYLRSLVSFVPQRPIILPTTIRENILYGDIPARFANEASMIAAAEATGIHEFILSLPKGYDTIIGEGGIGISGGEAQRLSIARALVRKPACLILDEPTSALDAHNASIIRDTIANLIQRQRETIRPGTYYSHFTVVVITHSVEMMQLADHIAVLDSGRLVEEGQYHELINKRQHFWNLIRFGE